MIGRMLPTPWLLAVTRVLRRGDSAERSGPPRDAR